MSMSPRLARRAEFSALMPPVTATMTTTHVIGTLGRVGLGCADLEPQLPAGATTG
jgi:hypothetical protein